MAVRSVTPADLLAVLRLNNDAVPAVNELSMPDLEWFVIHAESFLVVDDSGSGIDGFLIGLGPQVPYESTNYQWFSQRHEAFIYVDRVVVAAANRGSGVGTQLYDAFADRGRLAGLPVVLAEVNIRPRNESSLRFHERHGFVPVGEQDTEGGSKRVTMLEKRLT